MSAPIKLVTVNTNPERAKRLIGRMVEALKDRYTIDYVDNTTEIAGVEEVVKKNQPDILVCNAPFPGGDKIAWKS